MAKKRKQVDSDADIRISGKLSPRYHRALGKLAEHNRRSLTGQTEVIVMTAIDEAIENGIIDPIDPVDPNTTVTATISYDAALLICKAHAVDGVLKLKAIADTARTLGLDAEELLAQCHAVGLRTTNGNGHNAKVGATA